MPMQVAVRTVVNKYADFNGRARRSEFWFWALAVFIAQVIVLVIRLAVPVLGLLIDILLALAIIVPNLAVGCRRLHDTGKSGWLQLIGIIPLIGAIILIVLFCIDSDAAPNQYGPSPKAIGY